MALSKPAFYNPALKSVIWHKPSMAREGAQLVEDRLCFCWFCRQDVAERTKLGSVTMKGIHREIVARSEAEANDICKEPTFAKAK